MVSFADFGLQKRLMAKKKVASTKTPGKKGRVAGKEYDMTPPEFDRGSVDDIGFKTYTRETSKYKALVEAAIGLEDGECITIKVGSDEDAKKKRLNIAQVIMNKAKPQIEEGYKLRVRLNDDDSLVVVSCHYKGEDKDEDEETEE